MSKIIWRKDEVLPFCVKNTGDLFSINQVISFVNDLVANGYYKASFSLKGNDIVTDSRELAVILNNY